MHIQIHMQCQRAQRFILIFYCISCIGFTEKDCLELYKKAISESPAINLHVGKALTIGSPRVGKTNLRYLLLGLPPPTISASTPVIKAAETFGILPSAEQLSGDMEKPPDEGKDLAQICSKKGYLSTELVHLTSEQGGKDKWVLVNEASGLQSLLRYLREHLLNTAKFSSKFTPEVTHSMVATSDEKSSDMQIILQENDQMNPPLVPELKGPFDTTAQQLFQLLQQANVQDFPVLDAKLLQFLDCGGQLAYHDILPLFTTVPSIYLHVFNLIEDLMANPTDQIQFDGIEQECYSKAISPVTTAQMISRSAMTIKSLKSKKGNLPAEVLQSEPSEPRIMLVGTHLDVVESMCTERERERKMIDINTTLRKALKSDAQGLEEMVLKNCTPPLPSMFYPVNNRLYTEETGSQQSDIGERAVVCLRKRIRDQISCVRVKVPVKWYLYQLLEMSQSREGSKPVYKYRELYQSCRKDLVVDNVGEFHTMVTYFNALGLFVHLCGEDVKHTEKSACFIFTNPTYLSENVSKLYQVQFLEEERCEGGLLSLKRRGILTRRSLQDLQLDEVHLKHRDFMDLLVQLFIGAEIEAGNGEGRMELFVPSVLMQPPGGHSALHSDLQESQPQIVLTFKDLSFVPCGVFTGAITRLLSVRKWKISKEFISRIHIPFAVGARDAVQLYDCATHIGIAMAVSDVKKVQEYRDTVLNAIAESYCFLFHCKTSKDHQSAYCKECHCNPYLILGLACQACEEANHIAVLHVEDGDPVTVRCQETDDVEELSDTQQSLLKNIKHYVSVRQLSRNRAVLDCVMFVHAILYNQSVI